jgi:membrane fusion protein (multidrug efflux system)
MRSFISGKTEVFRQTTKKAAIWLPSLAILLTACGSKKESGPEGKGNKPPSLAAEVIVVSTAPLESVYQSSGSLLPNEEVSVYPEVAGRITSIHFKEGARVRKGDLLLQLFDNDIKAQIQKLKVQRKLQVITRERQDELLSISGISKQEYDNTVAQIAAIDADIAYAEAQLRRLEIRAPFDGVSGLRNVSVGAVVNTGTLITTIQQLNPLKLDFPLPEQYKNVLRSGDQISFTIKGSLDTMNGKVMAVQPGADAATRTLTVRALVPNADYKLVAGGFASVFVTLQTTEQSVTVPSQCIIPSTRDKKVAVLRNGKAELVTVITGMRMPSEVEIRSGLQAGDTVLATGIMQVKPGMQVKVVKVRNQPARAAG